MKGTTADKTDKIVITLPRSILQKIEKVLGDIPVEYFEKYPRV